MARVAFCRTSSIYDDSRSTKEIMALLEAGHHVTVIGWDRNYDGAIRCEKVFSKWRNIDFLFFQNSTGKNVFDKFVCRLRWARWLQEQLNNIGRLDVVHLCDFDTAFPVFISKVYKNVKIIYDIFDYYVDAHLVPWFIRGLVEYLERKIINTADCVIICNEERREQIRGTTPKRLLVIHNSPPRVELADEIQNLYDYAYCGSLDKGRLIREILEEYVNNDDLRFYIAGRGRFENVAKHLVMNHSNVVYGGPITYSMVLEQEKKAICLSAIYNPECRNHRLCAPNKFYEALALAKPLIVVRGTGIDNIVKKNNIGIVIEYDVKEFYHAVRYLKEHTDEVYAMGRRAKELYERIYSWDIMKLKLVQLYDSLS